MDKTRLLWTSALLAAALFTGGCFDRTNQVDIQLIKSNDCGSGPDPMQDVTYLRIRFLNATRCGPANEEGTRNCQVENGYECGVDADCGFGTVVKESVVEVGAGKMDFEQLEAGLDLQVQVAGFSGQPSDSSSRILSFGQSGTFKVPKDKSADVPAAKAVVFFRQVEKFSPINLASDPTVRTLMAESRAGHTATVLDDGRVLLAGGFDTTGVAAGNLKDPKFWKYKDTVEIFDPATGEVTSDVPPMNKLGSTPTPRAFHTASWKEGNQVLIAGGEYVENKGGVRSQTIQSNTILFDPTITDDEGNAKGGWAPQPSRIMRSRHVAVTEQTGMVLLYGGLSFDGTSANIPTYVQSYEWFNPTMNLFTKLDAASQSPTVTGVGHAGLPLYGGKYLGITGGSMLDTGNTGKLNKDRGMKFYMYRDDKMQEQTYIALPVPRTYVSIAGQGARYIIVGGFQAFDPGAPVDGKGGWSDLLPTTPYTGTDILNLKGPGSQPQILQGPSLDVPRGHTCSITLNDGRMLVIGGRGGKTTLESMAATAFFTDDGNEDPAAAFTFDKGDDMADARFFHTCTLLKDGSVLVTGGVQEKGAAFATLQTMEIFVPRPKDTN